MATHAGMSTEAFADLVRDWIATARHPQFNRPYTDLVYQPMLDVLALLRANDFKTFIVSGGGIEFMRTFSQAVYGVPPEQVIGSSIVTRYVVKDGEPALLREAELHFFDDKEGKPVAINTHIGRRPIAAFGNSDGDFAMLEWVTSGPGARFGLIVYHDDADRDMPMIATLALPAWRVGSTKAQYVDGPLSTSRTTGIGFFAFRPGPRRWRGSWRRIDVRNGRRPRLEARAAYPRTAAVRGHDPHR